MKTVELQQVQIQNTSPITREQPCTSNQKLKLKTVDLNQPIKQSSQKSLDSLPKQQTTSKPTQVCRQEIKPKETSKKVEVSKGSIKQAETIHRNTVPTRTTKVQEEVRPKITPKETKTKKSAQSINDIAQTLNPNLKVLSEQARQTLLDKMVVSTSEEPKPKEKEKPKKTKRLTDIKPSGITQSLVNVKDIKAGIILTKNNRYVQIIEILPVNFSQKPEKQQRQIIDNFETLFKNGPTKGHLKTVMEYADTDQIIKNIYQCCPNTRSKRIVNRRNDYINTIRSLKQGITLHYRYFYIWEYEGSAEGGYSTKFDEVYREMMLYKYSIKELLESQGNIVAFPESETKYVADILYRHFNHGLYMEQNLTQRMLRINYDYSQFNKQNGTHKKVNPVDYLAPHYYAHQSKWYVVQNNVFKSWLVIKSNGYPGAVPPEWLNIIRVKPDMDIDFYFKRLPHQLTKETMEKRSNLHNNIMQGMSQNKTNGSTISAKATSSNYILEHMRKGEDLFDCCTILTVYASSAEALRNKLDDAYRTLKNKGIIVAKANRNCKELYSMTAPLGQINNKVFNTYRRNILTSGMKNLYNYTAFSLYDETGVVLGPNLSTGTMTVFNSFNTAMYTNGNIIILGTPGAGKSFLEMSLGNRKIIMGEKCIYVLPTKGHEYQDFCSSVGGTYVRLVPGGEQCINVMEIFPKQNIDLDKIGRAGETFKDDSALAEKITSLVTWLTMLMVKSNEEMSSIEESKLNVLLKKLYAKFGITDDNDSLWKDKAKKIKVVSPIISDWKAEMEKDIDLKRFAPLLADFTEGSFSNLNGQTNVDLSTDCIVIDCEVTVIGKRKLPPILYIAFDCGDSIVKADTEHFDNLFMDEVWQMMINPQSAERVQEEARLLRGYGGAVILASQDIVEFMESKFGKVIIGTASIKIVLKMLDTEANYVKDILGLDENDLSFIQRCHRGTGLLISNGDKTRFALKTSESEEYYYTTDLNVKKRFKEKYAKKVQSHK